jgi:hypothetical protein
MPIIPFHEYVEPEDLLIEGEPILKSDLIGKRHEKKKKKRI